MSKCFIGLGKCSYLYFYILGLFAFKSLKIIFSKKEILVMNDHYLVHSIFTYFGFIVFGRLFNFILNRNLNEKEKENNKINDINSLTPSSELSYTNIKKLSKFDTFVFIIICIIFIIYFESIKI